MFLLDTGITKTIQKGQWRLNDLVEDGEGLLRDWFKSLLMSQWETMNYVELIEGPLNRVDVVPMTNDYEIEIEVTVKIRPRAEGEAPVRRKAAP